jgi:hypothetical protein
MTAHLPTPSAVEVERIRLLLSTYQDGSGMLKPKNGKTSLPGWRDFERAVAVALAGETQEDKSIFDVVIDDSGTGRYGVSCKMRRELSRLHRKDEITLEVSNEAGKFWDALKDQGIETKSQLQRAAAIAGSTLSKVVDGWHSDLNDTSIDVNRSFYLVLLWDSDGTYQLFQLPLRLYDPSQLLWSVPKGGSRLCGKQGQRVVVEWYFKSGGQLKVYPLQSQCTWQSAAFRLESPPHETLAVLDKVERYFPNLWATVAFT